MKINKISVRGVNVSPVKAEKSSGDLIELKQSYIVGSSTRGLSETHQITLGKNNILELAFEDGTRWFSGQDNLDEIFPEAAMQNRSAGDSFEIPSTLRAESGQRGIGGDVLLKVLNVFTKKIVNKTVHEVADELEKKQLEGYSGLYRLDADFKLQKFTPADNTKPYLLFLHGTASSVTGSFGGLKDTPLWNYIQQNYGSSVIAFQHESLTKSPLQNVYELVKNLSGNIDLHLISHSRGGLLGEILSRFVNNKNGFDNTEIECLNKAGRKDDVKYIKAIADEFKNKKITVSKFIRVACPARGTTLASDRLDNFFNITANLIGFGTGAAANPFYGHLQI